MLRIFLAAEQGRIQQVKITGDFFLHPEENLPKLEKELAGVSLTNDSLLFAIKSFLENNPTEVYGFSAEDLTKTILQVNNLAI